VYTAANLQSIWFTGEKHTNFYCTDVWKINTLDRTWEVRGIDHEDTVAGKSKYDHTDIAGAWI